MVEARAGDGGAARLSGREIALIFLFWTLLAALSIANRVIDPRGPGVHLVPPSAPVLLTLFECLLWAALTPLVFLLASRFSLVARRWMWRLALLIGIGLLLAFTAHLLAELLRVEVLEVPRRGPRGRVAPLRLAWFVNDFIVSLGVLAAGLARDYFLRFEARNREAARLQAEAAALQGQLAEAQLSALRMQLNPHFLFNTLHAVSALVERDPAGVRRMIARLGELLRSTLDESGRAERTVEQEMDFAARYLDIMRIRFQDRLQVQTVLDPEARAALVPTLVLQPLVENAVKHGVARLRGQGRIVVQAAREGDRVRLSVADNGPGPGRAGSWGVGLTNTGQRLRRMYGDAQRLQLRPGPEGGTLAVVEAPFRVASEPAAVGTGVEEAVGRGR